MCEVKLSDINTIYFFNDRVIIKIIARVTRANQDWNQEFNLEGILSEKSIMNFVYWLNEFLKEEHNLDLNNFENWEIQRLLFNPDRVNSENAINRNFFNSRPLISIRTCKIPFFNRLKIRIKPLVNRTYPLTYIYALLHNLIF